MKVQICKNSVVVTREKGDPMFYGTQRAAGESRLLYHLRDWLNAHGHDFIKKPMWKDGHMVDEMQQYLRTRSPKSKGLHAMIYNSSWAIRGANDDWNKDGCVTLAMASLDD